MTRVLTLAALLTGAFIILWMGFSFIGTDTAALLVTLVIGLVYLVGFAELLRYQQATTVLSTALSALQEKVQSLEQWLDQLPAALQIGVRLRIQGEHVGLPAPVLAPYLIGLLVMLGLLGTFIGMVDTLQGAVLALQGSTELEAIRTGLTAPIKGLGMAFGTSVAGVAASAMLGFVATLSRRDRLLASRLLDSKVGSVFQDFSLSYNRQQTYQAMQQQAQALPVVAEQLTMLVDKIALMGEQISNSLTDNQQQFHNSTQSAYSELASSVNQSLKQSLADSGRLAGESIKPVIEQMMVHISSEVSDNQQQLNNAAQQQLASFNNQMLTSSDRLSQTWQTALDAQHTVNSELITQISRSLGEFKQQLNILRDDEQHRGDAAVARLADLQQVVAEHLTTLGNSLEQPISQLVQSASETPRAAAELFEKMRTEISKQIERDNAMLEDRSVIMTQLNTLSDSLQQATSSQRDAIETMVVTTSDMLLQVGSQFTSQLDSETAKLTRVADNFAASSTEMSSLGESFGLAIELFNSSNNTLVESLSSIEQALLNSTQRSDEQLAYYVAQAREIIDHSMLSQQEVLDQLQLFRSDNKDVAGEAC